MADNLAKNLTDVEEGELEDEENALSQEQAAAEDASKKSAPDQKQLEELPADNPCSKTAPKSSGVPLFGRDDQKVPAVPDKNVLTTEEEEYFKSCTADAQVIVSKPDVNDDYQFGHQNPVDLQRYGLPNSFRGAGRGERGTRRPFRSRGFNCSFSNFRGKQNFNYRRMSPVPSFQSSFASSRAGESRRRSYSREKSLSPSRGLKRRRPQSRSPRRFSRRDRRSRSGRHSRRHSDSRSRSRSRSRKVRKKSHKRSRSRSGERGGLNDLRKRWVTGSSSSKKVQQKSGKFEQNGYSSSDSSSSSSSPDSEEERKKSVRRRVAKLLERCKIENSLQGALDLQLLSQQGLVPASQIQVTTVPAPIPVVTPTPIHLQLYPPHCIAGSISQFIPANSQVKLEKVESLPQHVIGVKPGVTSPSGRLPSPLKPPSPTPQSLESTERPPSPFCPAPRTPQGRKSPFVLKEAIDHSVKKEVAPVKKTRRVPRTPPPPPDEPYYPDESSRVGGSKSSLSPLDENVVVTPSDGPFGMLLIGLTRCCVKSEEDAQIALFVASSLTRGLADYYRAKHEEQEVSNHNESELHENPHKKEDSTFNGVIARSLPHLQDFQEAYRKTKRSEEKPYQMDRKIQNIVGIHDEISAIFNADDTNENQGDNGDNNNTVETNSPASSECLLELPEEVEVKARIPQKLEFSKPQIDPSAIRSRASAVWEPMFAGHNP